MEDFFRSLGMPVNLRELTGIEVSEEQISEMADKCSEWGTRTVGALKVLSRDDVAEIYRMAR